MLMPAAEDMDDSVAADDIRNSLGSLIESLRLILFDPFENSGYPL